MTGSRSRAILARCGTFLFRSRTVVLPLAILGMVVFLRPRAPNGNEMLDGLSDALGLAIALLGQALRAAVIGFAYIRRGGVDGKVHADELVTGGLFAHSRNPLYLGNILIMFGLLLVFNNPWAYLLGAPLTFFVYASIVAAEEEFLRARFGAVYDDYCRKVNRWWPDWRGLATTLAGLKFDWRRLIVKEYGSTYAWTGLAVLLLAREVMGRSSGETTTAALSRLAGLFILLTIGWGTARYLKKTRLLRPRYPLPPRGSVARAT